MNTIKQIAAALLMTTGLIGSAMAADTATPAAPAAATPTAAAPAAKPTDAAKPAEAAKPAKAMKKTTTHVKKHHKATKKTAAKTEPAPAPASTDKTK